MKCLSVFLSPHVLRVCAFVHITQPCRSASLTAVLFRLFSSPSLRICWVLGKNERNCKTRFAIILQNEILSLTLFIVIFAHIKKERTLRLISD